MRNVLVISIIFLQLQLIAQAKLAGSYGIDPSVQEFLEAVHAYKGPSLQELPLNIAREAMENMQKDSTLTFESVIFQRELLKIAGKEIKVVIVKPRRVKKKLPVLVYFHGGGWVFNSFKTHKRLMSNLAEKAGIGIVFVEYSLAPETKFPKANEEAYLVTLFISKYGEKYDLDSDKIIVGGDSAGGNMATVVAMMSKEKGSPQLQGQILLYPVTDANVNTNSYEQFSKGHYLSRDIMIWFWEQYAPDIKTHSLPKVSPLRASKEQLKNLPRTLIITAEYDVLRDEGEAYAKKLRTANVPVISTRYGGTIHDFIVLNALKNTEASKAGIRQICDFLVTIFSE